ncbi:MAG TPA: methicillin resistance protein [Firmicutes bacterium]|jgi:predicted transcriptional regulator|nr:methicillin resistance protein [Bacillota bacterium]
MQSSLGAQELELIRLISDSQTPLSAREIVKLFGESHGLARTTVLTMLERLRKKGFLVRTEMEGIYHYASHVPKGEFLQGIVRNFVEKTLEGSLSPFMAYLTQEAKISDSDLAELKQLIADLEQQHSERKDK